MTERLPADVRDEAERLTRLARDAVDEAEGEAYREHRDDLLADHGFTARVREDATLVLHPSSWTDDEGRVDVSGVDDVSRAEEIPLEGAGDPDDWEAVAAHNEEVAARVREDHGDVHGDNAAAFAAFMSNHYARTVESASEADVRVFLSEYFPRNAWPSDEQRDRVEQSLRYVFERVDREPPL